MFRSCSKSAFFLASEEVDPCVTYLTPPVFSSMRKGYLALVLHAHLPFVRHPEYPDFLEEDWLFEAITETYLPMLQVMWRMADEGVPFQMTTSLTPTLISML